MSVKLITFRTAQTLIGSVEDKEDSYVIKQPIQVMLQPTQDGNVNIGFAPFLEYAEEFKTGITIPKDSVMTVTTPVQEVLNQYNRIFGSGIEIASAMPNLR